MGKDLGVDSTFIIAIVIVSVAVPIVITIFAIKGVGNMLGGSPKKRAEAQRLVETGEKARATIMQIQPTGTIINELNIGCDVLFRLDPLSGAASFQAPKSMFINQTQMPRVGDVWPAWYDPTDPGQFAVGQPNLGDPSTIPVFREFGIPHPFDQTATGQAQAAAAGGGSDRVADLERLAQLHRDGMLNDAEYEAEKQKLLGG
jgi:hypothetical protein